MFVGNHIGTQTHVDGHVVGGHLCFFGYVKHGENSLCNIVQGNADVAEVLECAEFHQSGDFVACHCRCGEVLVERHLEHVVNCGCIAVFGWLRCSQDNVLVFVVLGDLQA